MNTLVRDRLVTQRFCLVSVLALVFMAMAMSASAFADYPADVKPMAPTEQLVRSVIVKSLQAEVARICKEMFCEPPSVSVTADLSEVLRALPEKLATSPTVQCHPVPCIAITADSWPHLMEVYAKSDDAVRRIALEVGLSRKENAMTVASASVKSVNDYGAPAISLAGDGKRKFSLNLCGVRVSLKTAQACVVDVAGHRLGALFEGEGELRLEPTCAKSRKMLVDFIPNPDDPIKVSRVFISCPFKEKTREPRQIRRLRSRVRELQKKAKVEGNKQVAESMEKFLKDCVESAYPYKHEKSLEGLAPHDGYDHPIVVVQTKQLGVFGFCFAGERGSETVVMTQPRTRSIVSFWESARARHEWTIPRVEQYSFDIRWLPEAMRFDVICEMDLAGIETGRDIRFMLDPVCNVRRCLIDGKESRFVQQDCSRAGRVATSLSSGFAISMIKGWLQITPPSRPDTTGGTDLSVEYSIHYGNAAATDALGASYFYDDAVVLHGDAVRWFPYVGWRPRAPLRTRISVPKGFMGVSIGKYEGKVTEKESDVFTYDASFSMPTSAFVVGKFKEYVYETKRRDGPKRPAITMLSSGDECVARRYLDVVATMVDWALKYCGDFPYEELRFVTMPGNRSWATMLVFPNSCLEMDITNYGLMSHEISHQWWGNEAGTINLDDQWMVEGGATFFTLLCVEDLNTIGSYASLLKNRAAWIRKFDSPPPISTGFRLPSELRMLFYFKGAFVFEMLRMATNNDRHFFETLKRYQQDAVKTGLTEPGIRSFFEKAIGHDLSDLFRLYLHKSELPGVQVQVTDVSTDGDRATISLSAQITPGGYELPYPIDVYPKSGQAPHRAVLFIGPDSGDYKVDMPFADVSRIVGNPEAMLLVAQPEQEDVELYVSPK